jgi:hypothetical protein
MKPVRAFVVGVALIALAAACSGTGSTKGSSGSSDAGAEGGSTIADGSTADGAGGGGTDGGGSTDDGGGADGAACPQYKDADKACMTAADCTTVAKGCYCGSQPVIGISKSISALADACETSNAMNCALGCANFPGQIADDGKTTNDGGTITVLCDNMLCHTVVQ